MGTANPYVNSAYEAEWQDGYDIAISHPPNVPDPWYVLEPDAQAVWSEGALAGNTDGYAEGWFIRLDADGEGLKPSEPELLAIGGHLAFEGVIHGVAHFGPRFGLKSFSGIATLPLTAFLILLDLESFPPEGDTVRGIVAGALSRVCGERGCGELFLPTCVSTGHTTGGDPLLDAGYWHGRLFMGWDGAMPEADAHLTEYPDHFVGVIRYQPAGERPAWEWIPSGIS